MYAPKAITPACLGFTFYRQCRARNINLNGREGSSQQKDVHERTTHSYVHVLPNIYCVNTRTHWRSCTKPKTASVCNSHKQVLCRQHAHTHNQCSGSFTVKKCIFTINKSSSSDRVATQIYCFRKTVKKKTCLHTIDCT